MRSISLRLLAASVCLIGSACTSSAITQKTPPASTTTTSSRSTTASTTTPGPCATPSHFGTDAATNEIHGASTSGDLWGLAFGPVPPRVGDTLKIVWRMTGTGPLDVALTAPDGGRRRPAFGPTAHPVSTYRRPGDEWDTGLRFTDPGCWHVHLTRTDTSGDIWLDIRA